MAEGDVGTTDETEPEFAHGVPVYSVEEDPDTEKAEDGHWVVVAQTPDERDADIIYQGRRGWWSDAITEVVEAINGDLQRELGGPDEGEKYETEMLAQGDDPNVTAAGAAALLLESHGYETVDADREGQMTLKSPKGGLVVLVHEESDPDTLESYQDKAVQRGIDEGGL